MRINKFFTENGICSRREADRWVEAGRVSINGAVAKPGDQVGEGDRVAVDGKPVSLRAKRRVVLAYHKPVGCVSTLRDPEGRFCIGDVVARIGHRGLFPVGRLDFHSSGLIVLTNDGALAEKLTDRKSTRLNSSHRT